MKIREEEGGRRFGADLWSRDHNAMQLLLVVLPPQHQPRRFQGDVHYVIATGTKAFSPWAFKVVAASCKWR